MYASVFVIALSQVLANNASLAVDWNHDYAKALKNAAGAGKALAIFIGSGNDGWQAVGSGSVSPEALKLLRERYVCLYVDAATADGKELAKDFEATQLPTLVISDKTATYQAVKQTGPLASGGLERMLEQYVAYDVQPSIMRASYYSGPSISTPTSIGGGCRT